MLSETNLNCLQLVIVSAKTTASAGQMRRNQSLTEKVRPKKFDVAVGQAKVKETCRKKLFLLLIHRPESVHGRSGGRRLSIQIKVFLLKLQVPLVRKTTTLGSSLARNVIA